MEESVLVVDRAALEERLNGRMFVTEGIDEIRDFIVRNHFFLPRSKAEYDAAAKQIIPYVVIRRGEEFFLLRLDAEETARLGAGRTLTALEQEVLDEFRWWPVDELAALAARETLYPIGLARLAPRWLAGWDGVCLRIEEP